jgi:hypothetical protein
VAAVQSDKWTWSAHEYPEVISLLDRPSENSAWWDDLERACDPIGCKVLSVIAAASIARDSLANASEHERHIEDSRALDLVEAWIDDPTDERSERICVMIFGEERDAAKRADLSRVVWWTLRTATASVDAPEASWALQSLCQNLAETGIAEAWLREVGLNGIRKRMRDA